MSFYSVTVKASTDEDEAETVAENETTSEPERNTY